jgi:hypothetical protein
MTPEQRIVLEEEKEAFEVDLNSKIHTANLLQEDMGRRDTEIQSVAGGFANVFKNQDDAELFAMLPLSVSERIRIIERARAFVLDQYTVQSPSDK